MSSRSRFERRKHDIASSLMTNFCFLCPYENGDSHVKGGQLAENGGKSCTLLLFFHLNAWYVDKLLQNSTELWFTSAQSPRWLRWQDLISLDQIRGDSHFQNTAL